MLKRFSNAGTIVISLIVFSIAFVGLLLVGSLQQPETIIVLAASKDLKIGDVLTPDSVTELEVVKDEIALRYIPAQQASEYYNGVVTIPFYTGQPIYASAVVALNGTDSRFVPVTQKYGDGIIFPLALDESNVIAPDISLFLPGDTIGVSSVIAVRPQEKPTPMPEVPYGFILQEPTAVLPNVPQPTPEKSPLDEELDRVYPPFSKNLFPGGLRVIAVQGIPEQATGETEAIVNINQVRPVLLVIVPRDKVEELSLVLQQSARVYITLLARGSDQNTYGFTYWDLEEKIRQEREQLFVPEGE